MEKSSSIQKKFFNWIFMHEDKNGKKKFAEKNAVALCLKKFISTAKAMQGLSPLKIIFQKTTSSFILGWGFFESSKRRRSKIFGFELKSARDDNK